MRFARLATIVQKEIKAKGADAGDAAPGLEDLLKLWSHSSSLGIKRKLKLVEDEEPTNGAAKKKAKTGDDSSSSSSSSSEDVY